MDYMQVGTDSLVCPYFLLVILFLLSYAFDKYAIVILSSYYSVDSSNTNQNTPDAVGCGLR